MTLASTRIDTEINKIVDAAEERNLEEVKRLLNEVPWGLITIDEAKAAMSKSALNAFDDLDINS
jgi:hypothetical protein